jgi:pentatricopeptide repeat protein
VGDSLIPVWGLPLYIYGICGYIDSACKVFDKMRHWDVVTRNAMIKGFMQNDSVDEVVVLFGRMSCFR